MMRLLVMNQKMKMRYANIVDFNRDDIKTNMMSVILDSVV